MTSRAQRRLRDLLFSYPKVFSHAEVAIMCGVTTGAVNHWCCARRRPAPEKMRILQDKLGIPMRDWFPDREMKAAG